MAIFSGPGVIFTCPGNTKAERSRSVAVLIEAILSTNRTAAGGFLEDPLRGKRRAAARTRGARIEHGADEVLDAGVVQIGVGGQLFHAAGAAKFGAVQWSEV